MTVLFINQQTIIHDENHIYGIYFNLGVYSNVKLPRKWDNRQKKTVSNPRVNNLAIKQIKLVFGDKISRLKLQIWSPAVSRNVITYMYEYLLFGYQRRNALQFINRHENILLELYKIRRLNSNCWLLYMATFVKCIIVLNLQSVSRTIQLCLSSFCTGCCNKQFTSYRTIYQYQTQDMLLVQSW